MFQSNEGELNPLGMTVGAMVQTSDILGFSGQPVQAIALERLDDRMGTWQYRLDGSVTWLTIDASLINRETNTLGLLLRAQDSIRLLPFGDLNGDVASALTFRAWDASTGVAGSYAVTTPGSGAFGAATDTLALKVNPVNDAPDFVFSNALSMQGAGLGDETAYSIAQQADGRFIVAGVVEAGPGSYFSLMRLNLDGTLDATFGDHGKALIAMALNQENRAHDILIQADGKVLVGGTSGTGSHWSFSLARLNSNGSLDTTFGTSGITRTPIGNGDHAGILSLQLQPDGRILASGYSNIDGAWKATIARYTSIGILDTSFDIDGIVPVQTRTGDEGGVAALRDDGKITVVGNNASSMAMARLNADGSYDAALDGDGRLQLAAPSAGLFAATTQVDGNIVAVGSAYGGADWKVSVYRVNAAGGLDTSFGSSGRVLLDWGSGDDFGQNVVIQNDGKILVAGYSRTSKNPGAPYYEGKYDTRPMQDAVLGVMRLNADGSLDTSFDGDGRLTLALGSQSFAFDLLVQADRKIVLTGAYTEDGRDRMMVVRLNSDGSLDQEFGGVQSSHLGASVVYTENGTPIPLDSDVRVSDPELAALEGGLGNYAGASLVLSRVGGANPSDVFDLTNSLSLDGDGVFLSELQVGSFSQNNGELTIQFNQNATQARVNQLLSSITYSNTSEALSGLAQIAWRLSDGNTGSQGSGGPLAGAGVTTIALLGVNDLPSGEVSISGPMRVGSMLTASNTLQDADGFAEGAAGAIRYEWYADGFAIAGANSNQYPLLPADKGKVFTVSASYQDRFGTLESVSSGPTQRIAAEHFAYHWKSHMLLPEVQVGSMSAHAGAADSSLFDLRAAVFDAATSMLTVQVWSTPASASANFDFNVGSTGAFSASFSSALGTSWTVLTNNASPGAISVSGLDGTLSGFATATQLGTLTLQYAPGTSAISVLFSGLNVGDQSAADLNLSVMSQVTGSDGSFSLPDDGPATTAIKVSLGASDTGNAVTSADALAALRIAVGLNPNADPDGAGPLQPLRISPYQFMAADANGSGTVTSADALAILRMAVKLADALPNEWFFVEETRDFWNEVTQQYTLTRTAAAWDRSVVIDASASSAVGVVGVLKGDVNGSWSAPAGSVDLDTLDPNYFTSLATRMAVPTDQWGV